MRANIPEEHKVPQKQTYSLSQNHVPPRRSPSCIVLLQIGVLRPALDLLPVIVAVVVIILVVVVLPIVVPPSPFFSSSLFLSPSSSSSSSQSSSSPTSSLSLSSASSSASSRFPRPRCRPRPPPPPRHCRFRPLVNVLNHPIVVLPHIGVLPPFVVLFVSVFLPIDVVSRAGAQPGRLGRTEGNNNERA